jgi:hypothetical protein
MSQVRRQTREDNGAVGEPTALYAFSVSAVLDTSPSDVRLSPTNDVHFTVPFTRCARRSEETFHALFFLTAALVTTACGAAKPSHPPRPFDRPHPRVTEATGDDGQPQPPLTTTRLLCIAPLHP